MALINCPDCGKEVSDSAKTCNGCGRPMECSEVKRKRKASVLTWVIMVAFLGGVIGLVAWTYYRQNEAARTVERLSDQYRIKQLSK